MCAVRLSHQAHGSCVLYTLVVYLFRSTTRNCIIGRTFRLIIHLLRYIQLTHTFSQTFDQDPFHTHHFMSSSFDETFTFHMNASYMYRVFVTLFILFPHQFDSDQAAFALYQIDHTNLISNTAGRRGKTESQFNILLTRPINALLSHDLFFLVDIGDAIPFMVVVAAALLAIFQNPF